MADNNQVPDSTDEQKNENNGNAFGIIKDSLKDASKIIGDKRFQKFIDLGSGALMVGSLLMSDENSKKALAVGIALKVGMGIYKAGGIKEYFDENVNAAKQTYAEFKDFVQGKEDQAVVTKAYVSSQNKNNKIDYTGVSMDHVKSSFTPDENDRFKMTGVANYSLNVPAENRKEAILKSVSCLNADFSNRGMSMRRKDFALNSVDKVDKGNYVVNCSVNGCPRSAFNIQNTSFYQLGQNAFYDAPKAAFASNSVEIGKNGSGLFKPFSAEINVAKDTLSTERFMNDMESFSSRANVAKVWRVNLNRAELNKQAFESEFGTGKETGLDKAKFAIKGVRQFGSLDKFAQVRSDLDRNYVDSKKSFSDSISRLKSGKSAVLKSFETLNVSFDSLALDKAKVFDSKVDSFISNLENDKVSRTMPVIGKDDEKRFIEQSKEAPFELARVCSDLKTSAESCVKTNNVRYNSQVSEFLKDQICNSSGMVGKSSLSCDDYFVKGMKEVYNQEGREAAVPKTLVIGMIENYGKDKASDTLGRLSPDHVRNPEKVKSDIGKAANQLEIQNVAKEAFEKNPIGRRQVAQEVCVSL